MSDLSVAWNAYQKEAREYRIKEYGHDPLEYKPMDDVKPIVPLGSMKQELAAALGKLDDHYNSIPFCLESDIGKTKEAVSILIVAIGKLMDKVEPS